MLISVSGVTGHRAAAARDLIRSLLEPWSGSEGITLVAHRLDTGEWSVLAFDGVDLVMIKDGLAERLRDALRDLPETTG